jgi:hypothetical protein
VAVAAGASRFAPCLPFWQKRILVRADCDPPTYVFLDEDCSVEFSDLVLTLASYRFSPLLSERTMMFFHTSSPVHADAGSGSGWQWMSASDEFCYFLFTVMLKCCSSNVRQACSTLLIVDCM